MRFTALSSLVAFAVVALALPAGKAFVHSQLNILGSEMYYTVDTEKPEPINTCIRSGEHYIDVRCIGVGQPASPPRNLGNRFKGVNGAAKVGEQPEAFQGVNA
ncbi:hypothetical protein R3P38DRAFT_2911506 [Favolaschia claudopus]|uniref:Uncharacterized protein n=1 Tax=Favolaschia claudopus TaxID=2862362 RepID=A0AAW0CED4_9AGAR